MKLTNAFAKLRWDSSDPERNPPPLPLPNQSSESLTTRPNTSAAIASAARTLIENAREGRDQTPSSSPDKSLIKGAAHRRIQSIQSGNVRDLRSYLDGMRSPERSPERDDNYLSSPERSPTRSGTPTPAGRDPIKDTPTLKPSRPGPRPILGENTPPSSTMLALQAMASRDAETPLSEITNNPLGRGGHSFDNLSSEVMKITSIATNLQKEMTQLSRRSKDNATDLISLKEATKTRDEDIRKTLRELVTNISSPSAGGPGPFGGSRSGGFGLGLLDSKPYNSPPSASKSFSVPRAASTNSFFDPDRVNSPSPYSVEGTASLAMLEKILREMVTKEGQERLLSNLSELLEKASKENVGTAKKVEELMEFIKEKSDNQALVRSSAGVPRLELTRSEDSPDSKRSPDTDALRLMQKVKESITTNGGMTAELKALIQQLRGETLGMGRELGRKLDEAIQNRGHESSAETNDQMKADMENIVHSALADLKEHMESIIDEKNQQMAVAAVPGNNMDPNEMHEVVRHAISEHGAALVPHQQDGLDREGILEAVRGAYEEFKPEIELQQFGLERDEILQVLKEGLEDYQSSRALPAEPGASKEEILEAVHQAMQNFQPPQPAVEMQEELLASVRACLEDFRPSSGFDPAATHMMVVEAVREGLANHGPNAPRELEISRDDLFDAVKASLDGSSIPFGGFGEQVLQQMNGLIDSMHGEFQQYSAANGRDTEQVLDAVKDGLESLRSEIESYVDRAQDVTGKDEIIDIVRDGLEQLRADVQGYCAEGPTNGRNEMLDYIKAEFEHLHEAFGSQGGSRSLEGDSSGQSAKAEILAALALGFEGIRDHARTRSADGDEPEEMVEAMKEEFEQLKNAILSATATDKSEIMETIQESLGTLHNKIDGAESLGSSEGTVADLKEELVHLREALATTLIRSGGSAEKEDIIDAIQESMNGLRTQLTADHGEASGEVLATIKEELESFRDSLGNGSLRSTRNPEDPDAPIPAEVLEAIRGEFENMRQSINQTMVVGGSRADTEEVLDTVRLGLDDLRSHLEKKLDNPERNMAMNNELLDALNDGLDNLRSEFSKVIDKPVDMTVNYEILDTLKDGITSLRNDMDKLMGVRPVSPVKGGEIVLADGAESVSRDMPVDTPAASVESVDRASLEKMEVLIAQLQIKIEAMDANIQDMPATQAASAAGAQPAEGTALKQDLVSMEEMLKDIQTTLAAVAAREKAEVEDAVTKADTDAIETLLRNTKAQLEEIVMPDPATAVTKEDLDSVEAVVRISNDAIEGLAAKMEENGATKADVAVVEVLVQDLKSAFDEVREKLSPEPKEDEDGKPLTRMDLDILGIICTEIKIKVNDMTLPDPETLPTTADIEQLTGLINDFRASHDKLRDSYEQDIATTAKVFDDRRKEAAEIVEEIGSVKTYLDECKDELLDKVLDGENGMNSLHETLKGMEEKLGEEVATSTGLKGLLDTINNEFERAHGSIESLKVQHDEGAAAMLEKHGEHKDLIVAEVIEKIEGCFDGLMSKYDDAQHAAEEKAKAMEEKATQQEQLLTETKTMADDLRISIDTLGTSLTTMPETMEKISEDSKTVFNRVDDTYNKLEETQEGLKAEHQLTRDEVSKVIEGVSGLQGDFTEYHPRFMMSLKEIQALVQQHYEHSQQQAEAVRAGAEEAKVSSAEGLLTAEGLRAETEGLKAHFADELDKRFPAGNSSLPALLPEAAETSTRDDTAVHEKLDKLMEQASQASDPSVQLERLDQIHQQVMATAAEVSAFVALQAKQISDDHSNKEKEAEEIALVLERRLMHKEQVESDITTLNAEKESLRKAVEALRAEKEALTAQKTRLTADVASLHTAMDIRREELHAMDAKADALERRILEGVMNHSRAMLLTKSPKPSSPKKPKGRDLRLVSNASAASAATITSTVPPLQQSHALAMKTRPGIKRTSAAPNSAERRIMSLSHINHNSVSPSHSQPSATPSTAASLSPLKRSHSAKSNALRKQSWGGRRNFSMTEDANKENDRLSEESEGELSSSRPVSASSNGRSYGTSAFTDASGITPTDDGRRTSYATSDMTYATGSYLTGSELDRRSSLASTVAGTLGTQEETEAEAEAEAEQQQEREREQRAVAQAMEKNLVQYAPPSDSGIGTDLPTAAFSGSEADYFRRGVA